MQSYVQLTCLLYETIPLTYSVIARFSFSHNSYYSLSLSHPYGFNHADSPNCFFSTWFLWLVLVEKKEKTKKQTHK